jgi:RNA polymerase I-specific transcription initiation factor RRN7
MNSEPCDQCGSREFYIQDGATYCANGHDQNRGPEIGEDDDDYGTQGKRINTKERTKKQKVPKVYSGKKAYRLFLQAYQHILWKQCHALVHGKGFPGELWTVVRDLWTLRLSKLLRRVEDHGEGSESETQGLPSGVDSQDESGGETGTQAKTTASGSPSLIETICLCYMGMLLMRLPVRLSQMLRWVREEDVPYIRAIRYVPAEMKEKLPGEYHEALDTMTVVRPEMLQSGIMNLCCMYSRSYGMEIPPLNTTPILYDHIKNLSLPLEVYAAVQKLNGIVSFDFKYVDSGKRRRTMLSYPEAQLMSLIIITTKLLFPFDNDIFQRHPQHPVDQSMLMLDWKAWMDTRTTKTAVDRPDLSLEKGAEINVKDTDVFRMSASQLDQYMDWYQLTWARTEISDDDLSNELLQMFPLQQVPDKHINPDIILQEDALKLEQLRAVQAKLKPSKIITEEQAAKTSDLVLRLGMGYQQFRNQRALSRSAVARAFHLEAAELSCLTLDMLLRAVLQTERKITLWRRAKRRAERFGETIDLEAEGLMLHGLEGLDKMTLAESGIEIDQSDSGSDDGDEDMKMLEE